MKHTKIEQALLDRMTFDEAIEYYDWLVKKIDKEKASKKLVGVKN